MPLINSVGIPSLPTRVLRRCHQQSQRRICITTTFDGCGHRLLKVVRVRQPTMNGNWHRVIGLPRKHRDQDQVHSRTLESILALQWMRSLTAAFHSNRSFAGKACETSSSHRSALTLSFCEASRAAKCNCDSSEFGFGSVCVRQDEARTYSSNFGISSKRPKTLGIAKNAGRSISRPGVNFLAFLP